MGHCKARGVSAFSTFARGIPSLKHRGQTSWLFEKKPQGQRIFLLIGYFIKIYHLTSFHSKKCSHPYKECVCFLQVSATQHRLPDGDVRPLFRIKDPKSSLWGNVLPPAPRGWALDRSACSSSLSPHWRGHDFLQDSSLLPTWLHPPHPSSPSPPSHTHKRGGLATAPGRSLRYKDALIFYGCITD